VNRILFLIFLFVYLGLSACSPSARSKKSFDEIRKMVSGKTEAEVEKLLGAPDHHEKLLFGDERWTWWNYTYLGKEWAPEVRNRIVHLEITFAGPLAAVAGREKRSQWRVSEPYGIGFSFPISETEDPSLPLNKSTSNSI
jgi:hypothetical protein